jgi:hypothetical protein
MISAERNEFLAKLKSVGLEVVDSYFSPPFRDLKKGWYWAIVLRGSAINRGPMFVDTDEGRVADPENKDLRHFLKKMADDHEVKTFSVGSHCVPTAIRR